MTAIAEDLDLIRHWWQLAPADPLPRCDMSDEQDEGEPERCPLAAVARFWWNAPCGHAHDASCYCADHRDSVLRALERGTICCVTCDGAVTLARIEPLR